MNTLITNPAVASGAVTITTSAHTITQRRITTEEILDRFSMNEITVEHRVQEQELLKLKEVSPDFADIIKENMAKSASREIIKKMTFTKKQETDTFVHSFRGRCWVFNKDELKQLIDDIRNG